MKVVDRKKFLVLILIIASFLRLWKISEVPVSLFGDELDVGYHAYSILKTGKDYSGNQWPIHFQSLAEWRTPLYLYSAVPTVALFGISPLGVRLPAAIFGVLGVWGICLLANILFDQKKFSIFNRKATSSAYFQFSIGEISALVLALSPWHIQYSRAGFEVTMLLTFLLFGLFFFLKSLDDSRFFWISVVFLAFMPWIYSTAKLFTPILLFFLFLLWRRRIFDLKRTHLLSAVLAGLIVGLPIAYSTIFGGGAQRAGYTSVFTDPTIEHEVGVSRMRDASMRNENTLGLQPKFSDRLFHNKLTFWFSSISKNYFQSLSSDFLFDEGDPNLRHSIKGMGQFYKIEFIALILGFILFFTSEYKKEIKYLIAFWILIGVLPAALTRDGGNHATRLILILPPLIFLISFGIVEATTRLKKAYKNIFLATYCLLLATNFVFYQHNYWVHNPWDSERWWHAGFKEAIQSIKALEKNYDKVIISMAGEPAWIFFAGWYEYPPEAWHKEFPIDNDEIVEGFGKISHTGKYYFGTFGQADESLYDLSKFIDDKTLYMAVAKEIGANLVRDPQSTPQDLRLVKAIPYPSGEPAYYLLTSK